MPSTPQLFLSERSDIILFTAVPSMHWNSNEDITFCFMYVLIVYGVSQCILFDKCLPILAKNELKLDAISCFEFVLFPLIIKKFGNESLFLFLFKISLMVDQVRRMLNLYSSIFFALYSLFANLIFFLSIELYMRKLFDNSLYSGVWTSVFFSFW